METPVCFLIARVTANTTTSINILLFLLFGYGTLTVLSYHSMENKVVQLINLLLLILAKKCLWIHHCEDDIHSYLKMLHWYAKV